MSPTNPVNPAPQTRPTGDRRAELERIRDAVWPPNESEEARKARIARNLAALAARPKWESPLDTETIKWLAEDPDLADMQ